VLRVYFAFETNRHAGVGDQLGAQFAHVYALGRQCGWTYVRTAPIQFDRPCSAGRYGISMGRMDLDTIIQYLGLNAVEDRPVVDHTINIQIADLIRDAGSVSEVNDRIVKEASSRQSDINRAEVVPMKVLVNIDLGSQYYRCIPMIQNLTNMNWEQTLQFAGASYLRHQMKQQAMPIDYGRDIAVAHIRIGDSIVIDTPHCPVILHGNNFFTSLVAFQEQIGSVDSKRTPTFNPIRLSESMQSLLRDYGYSRESLFITSDGFKTTKACIWSHIRSRKLGIRIGISALTEIYRLERMFQESISWIPYSQRIIGEEPEKTLESIRLFAQADFLMCNSGGFSNVMFHLYNPMAQAGDRFVWL